MPRRKDEEYDSFEDDDSDDGHMAGMVLKSAEGVKHNRVNGYTRSRFPAPTKLWPFNYITGAWKDYIVTRGVGKDRAKRFLADEWLVNGSEHGGIETHWSDPHEFWEAAIATTSQKGFFFSGEAVDELCNMLAEQCEQVQKPSIKPDNDKSLRVATAIEPGSLKPVSPRTVRELQLILESMKGEFFSFVFDQSRKAWQTICTQGGACIALRTQRYEADTRLVLEIGWAALQLGRGNHTLKDEFFHAIVDDNKNYKNGLTLPDNSSHFGYGKTVTLPEEDIMAQLLSLLSELSAAGPVVLVLHDASTELEYFSKHANVAPWSVAFPKTLYAKSVSEVEKKRSIAPHYPVIIQDTQKLYAAFTMNPQFAEVALSRACKDMPGITPKKMNNAGNDAYYILQLYDTMLNPPA